MAIVKKDLSKLTKDELYQEGKDVEAKIKASEDLPALKAYHTEIIAAFNGDLVPSTKIAGGGKRTRKGGTATVAEVTKFVVDYCTTNKVPEVKAPEIRKYFDARDMSCSAALDDAARGNAAKGLAASLALRSAGKGKDGGNFYSPLKAKESTEKAGQKGEAKSK